MQSYRNGVEVRWRCGRPYFLILNKRATSACLVEYAVFSSNQTSISISVNGLTATESTETYTKSVVRLRNISVASVTLQDTP